MSTPKEPEEKWKRTISLEEVIHTIGSNAAIRDDEWHKNAKKFLEVFVLQREQEAYWEGIKVMQEEIDRATPEIKSQGAREALESAVEKVKNLDTWYHPDFREIPLHTEEDVLFILQSNLGKKCPMQNPEDCDNALCQPTNSEKEECCDGCGSEAFPGKCISPEDDKICSCHRKEEVKEEKLPIGE